MTPEPMRITILSHNLSSNASMRAHRLAVAARHFAEVTLLGPVEPRGLWPALPREPWTRTVTERRFPSFSRSFLELVEAAKGDVLIACKPMLASFGAALVAAESRGAVPVILDLDDLDTAFAPRQLWPANPSMADLRRPASAVYVSLLTRAAPAAAAVTASSTALAERFGGTVVPHGCLTELFDPGRMDREAARREFGFEGRIILFAGTPRFHKGIKPLAKAVRKVDNARLALLCRPGELPEAEWKQYRLLKLPLVPYADMPRLMAAADILAIPQLDTEAGRNQMPMKVYDCMAMGKPIVATAVSDLPQVLEGCALVVPAGSSAALKLALRHLVKHPEEGRALGEKARTRCLAEFSMQRVAERLFEVVQRVAPAAAKKGPR
jgi:glycosyltransferase involved in cell wall biosynthesis